MGARAAATMDVRSLAEERVYVRDGVLYVCDLDGTSLQVAEAIMARTFALCELMPHPRRCVIDLSEVRHVRFEKVRTIARCLREARPEQMADHTAFVVPSRIVAAGVRFAIRPFVRGYTIHATVAEAQRALLRAASVVGDVEGAQ